MKDWTVDYELERLMIGEVTSRGKSKQRAVDVKYRNVIGACRAWVNTSNRRFSTSSRYFLAIAISLLN